jgi:hypothetical protein
MIKYNNNTIYNWNFDTSNVIKVYRSNAIVFYKVSGESPTPEYKVCYAVVDDISQYQETEFDDVYDNATEKWYKLNNLNAYEEYGVYGSGRSVTTYKGKLTIDDGYEYEWNGSSWVNLGEVTGSSRVPIGYTEVEYVRHSTNLQNNKSNAFKVQCDTTSGNVYTCVMEYEENGTYDYFFGNSPIFLQRELTSIIHCGYYNYRDYSSGHFTSNVKEKFVLEPKKLTIYDESDVVKQTVNLNSSAKPYTAETTFGLMSCYKDDATMMIGNLYYFKVENANGDLLNEFIPCKRDSDDQVGVFDTVNDTFYFPSAFTLNAGPNSGIEEYPKYYSEKSDPLNNLTFNTMAEAQAYAYNNCVYDGMHAIIGTDRYYFDSTDENGWVQNESRLPQGYTEVEYVQNYANTSVGTSYLAFINTNFKPNQDTRIVMTMKCDKSNNYSRFCGAGSYDKTNAIQFDYETGAQGTLHISWGAVGGWITYSNCVGDYNTHEYDWNKNYFYRDKGTANEFSASTTYTAFQCTDNLGIFTNISNGSGDLGYNVLYGSLYSCQIYDNGTLIRDFVPCINPNNVVGVYDIVNNVFYQSGNGNSFVAGPEV